MISRTLTTKKLPFFFHTVDSLAVHPCERLAPPLKALFSTHIVGDKPVLVRQPLSFLCIVSIFHFFFMINLIGQVRDFIHSALYDPKHGYFSQRSRSVGVLETSIKFNQLQGIVFYLILSSYFFGFFVYCLICDLGFVKLLIFGFIGIISRVAIAVHVEDMLILNIHFVTV